MSAERMARRAEAFLSLAAAPVFTLMALWTLRQDGASEVLCSPNASPFGGMVLMYLLMSAFHAAPWIRRIARLTAQSETPSNPASPL